MKNISYLFENFKNLEVRRSWFDPCFVRQHSFMEIDHKIFSSAILILPLIQEGQLSVSGERICTSTG